MCAYPILNFQSCYPKHIYFLFGIALIIIKPDKNNQNNIVSDQLASEKPTDHNQQCFMHC